MLQELREVRGQSDVYELLGNEFSLSRLNSIHQYLWMAGRPMNIRPLHRQIAMNRRILITERGDLHLLWERDQIFLKPLQVHILKHEFWEQYICGNDTLFRDTCGFLMSYIWLICSPLDFHHAVLLGLLPCTSSDWIWWKTFVRDFLSNAKLDDHSKINQRYHYGELRLGRVNWIYRLAPSLFPKYLVRGYTHNYTTYSALLYQKFGWVLAIFAYFSLALSAMQLGLTAPPMAENKAFQQASYGLAVFSVIMLAVLIVFIFVLFTFFVVYNLIATVGFGRRLARKALLAKGIA